MSYSRNADKSLDLFVKLAKLLYWSPCTHTLVFPAFSDAQGSKRLQSAAAERPALCGLYLDRCLQLQQLWKDFDFLSFEAFGDESLKKQLLDSWDYYYFYFNDTRIDGLYVGGWRGESAICQGHRWRTFCPLELWSSSEGWGCIFEFILQIHQL